MRGSRVSRSDRPRPPDSWRRGQRRPRDSAINWRVVAAREGWLREAGGPRAQARRSDTEVAAELRCSRSLVSRRRRRFGALAFTPADGRRPPVEELLAGETSIRLDEVSDVAGGRSRARRWLREYVDAGVLVAVGLNRSRRWCIVHLQASDE